MTNRKIQTAVTALALLVCTGIRAEQAALTYYMPLTQLVFNIEYEQVIETTGVFSKYTERYLGTKDRVKEDKQYFILRSVSLSVLTVADPDRSYQIPIDKQRLAGLQLQRTADGRLLALNTTATDTIICNTPTDEAAKEPAYRPLPPLMEEQMLASSTSKMAENTAKLIYRIREQRLNLIAGDAEHQPADAGSMQMALKELDRQEEALCALFVGTTQTQKLSKQILLTPTQSVQQQCLFRFSYFSGVVDADDLSGEPVYLTINAHKKEAPETDEKKKTEPSFIYYNTPGQAQITVADENTQFTSNLLDIAQFGFATPLPQELFIKNTPQILFNPQTGEILSIK